MKNIFEIVAAKIDPSDIPGLPTREADNILGDVLTLVYFFTGVVAMIVLIIAGIMYATANGDSSRITAAKNTILYSIVGLVLILMAFTITGFVIGRF